MKKTQIQNEKNLWLSKAALAPQFEGQKIKKVRCSKEQQEFLFENCISYKPSFSLIWVLMERRICTTGDEVLLVYILNRKNVNKKGKQLKDDLRIVFDSSAIDEYFNKYIGSWHDEIPEYGKTHAQYIHTVIKNEWNKILAA